MLSNNTKATTFAISNFFFHPIIFCFPIIHHNFTKLYVPIVTLSAQDNAKLLQQLNSGFRRTINWNKYQSNLHLDLVIGPCFDEVNRLFVLSFENTVDRTVHSKYYLPTVEIKVYNDMIDGQSFFDLPVRSNLKTYDKT